MDPGSVWWRRAESFEEINQLELEEMAVGAFVHELKKTHRTSTATLTHDPLY